MSSNDAIIGTTLSGVVALTGLGVLNQAARKLNDSTTPDDFPKKKSKKRDTWY